MTRLGPPGSTLPDPKPTRDASSDDEDEGRAAAFARRGTVISSKGTKKRKRNGASDPGLEAAQAHNAENDNDLADAQVIDQAENEQTHIRDAPALVPTKSKPKSFLDELLADKAGKRKKKSSSKTQK